ncbi:MAG: class I SAM-dependent methyltransferase [Verrucomicrobiota bacterium]
MAFLDFISGIHQSTKRDYLARVTACDKAEAATIAKRFDREYFDGDRIHGYGGYRYDGRWVEFSKKLIAHYGLKSGDRVLDIGCGKGFLVHDLTRALPGLQVEGVDISEYAIENAMPEIQSQVQVGSALKLPYADHSFDLVLSINVLHNFRLPELEWAIQEIERVGKEKKFVVMDSYRNEREKVNLLYWQLTCEAFFTPEEWEWVFHRLGYRGDYDFVCFE